MGDDEKKAGGDPGAAAARQEWFCERVVTSLHVKADRFKKLMLSEGGAQAMLDFFDLAECQRVFVCEGGKNELVCFDSPPANQKKKMIYFLKPRKVAVLDAAAAAAEVLCGDLLPGVLRHMYDTTSEVYLPLLSNVHNQQGLPEVVIKDVLDFFHRLVASVYVTIGHTKGETLLPLPPMELPAADRASKDKERVHVLETAVVTWTKQNKNVLRLDPEMVLKNGSHPVSHRAVPARPQPPARAPIRAPLGIPRLSPPAPRVACRARSRSSTFGAARRATSTRSSSSSTASACARSSRCSS